MRVILGRHRRVARICPLTCFFITFKLYSDPVPKLLSSDGNSRSLRRSLWLNRRPFEHEPWWPLVLDSDAESRIKVALGAAAALGAGVAAASKAPPGAGRKRAVARGVAKALLRAFDQGVQEHALGAYWVTPRGYGAPTPFLIPIRLISCR